MERTRWTDERLDELAESLLPLPAAVASNTVAIERLAGELGELRREIAGDMRDLRSHVAAQVQDVRGEMRGFRGEIGGQMQDFRGEMQGFQGEIRGEVGGLRADLWSLQRQITAILAMLVVALIGALAAVLIQQL